MAQRKSAEPLVKVTLNLFETDYFFIQEFSPNKSTSETIRMLCRAYVMRAKAHANGEQNV